MIRILLDSSSDLTAEDLRTLDMELVPIPVTINGTTYRDGIDISKDDFYTILVESGEFPMTSQPSPQDLIDIFEDAKAKGDSLIYITLSSGLSGTYQSAILAKDMVEYDEIYIVDSLTATRAIHIIAEYAGKLRYEGKTAREIAEELESFRSRVKVLAAIDTLEYLYKGGRLSKATAAVGELANLKIIISFGDEGKLTVPAKCLGRNKALATLTKMITEQPIDTTFPIYSLYASGEENTAKLESKLAEAGTHVTRRLQIGSTIGAHIGPGAYGVILVTK